MKQRTNASGFIPSAELGASSSTNALWFAFRQDELLVRDHGARLLVPASVDIQDLGVTATRKQYLGTLDGMPCFSAELSLATGAPKGWRFSRVGEAVARMDPGQLEVALHAFPILNWARGHQYCGACGSATVDVPGKRAKLCPSCGARYFPRISATVFVLIHDGPKLFLVKSRKPPVKWYGLVSGFLETGETLEACAIREVREEAGLIVDTLEYQGSLPWPEPHQIMIGYRARYVSGIPALDDGELEEAGWFQAGSLPEELPPPFTLSRRMIDGWAREQLSA
jgi:NAD+ diphosphatase